MLNLGKFKKTVGCILCAGILAAQVTANAATDGKFYVNEDFDRTLEQILAEGWVEMDAGGETTAGNGTVRCEAKGQTGSQGLKYNVSLPTKYVATFRIKANTLAGNGRFQPIIYANGTRVFLQIYASKVQLRNASGFQSVSKATEAGAWYTYTCSVNNGVADVYRQKDGGSVETLFENFALHEQSGAYLTMSVEGNGANYIKIK